MAKPLKLVKTVKRYDQKAHQLLEDAMLRPSTSRTPQILDNIEESIINELPDGMNFLYDLLVNSINGNHEKAQSIAEFLLKRVIESYVESDWLREEIHYQLGDSDE